MTVMYKEIKDFDGYRVGDDGTVWSNLRPKWFYHLVNGWYKLEPVIKCNGYLQVTLCKYKKHYSKQIHTLVLETFIGLCPKGCVGAHNDGDPTNNRLDNLRWDTQQNNLFDRHKHGTLAIGSKHGMSIINEDVAREIKRKLFYDWSVKDLCKEYGLPDHIIKNIKSNKTWKHVNIF